MQEVRHYTDACWLWVASGPGVSVELFRLLVVLMLVAIVYNLGAALFSLSRGNRDPVRDSRKMVRSLTWRIGLSVALFVLLFVAWRFGWIHPHQVGGR
jgi:Protein of unknown function (DUF2909)